MGTTLEERLLHFEGALQNVTAALNSANAREHSLTVEVQRLGAVATPVASQPDARQQTKVDTRTLGKPVMVTGEEQKWQDWKTVVSAYCSVVDLQMGVIMDSVATGASTNTGLTESEAMMLLQLFFILVRITRGQPLTMVTNVGTSGGFPAGRSSSSSTSPPCARSRRASCLASCRGTSQATFSTRSSSSTGPCRYTWHVV